MTESPLMNSGFAILVFSLSDDLIVCLNKAMAFLIAVASSRFLSTNNQLRTSSNTKKQTTIQDGRVTVQQVQGRQGQSYSGTSYKSNATSSGENNANGQARVVKCYNCQDEEQLAFLAEPRVPDDQVAQTIIPNNVAFQTEDLDTYNSDCDDISHAKAILMANISNYGSDVISEVPHFETYLNDMENQSVHAMQEFEQTPVMDVTDNEITKAPKELPKVSLVNESLKKLKLHLANFDKVVKIKTTPNARTEEIAKKELLLENDRLLQQIMSQDVLLTVMKSMSLNGKSVNMERKRNESCDKCFNLDAELLKS
nr:hypothetical protein [Tanacetum cinerariifolium]